MSEERKFPCPYCGFEFHFRSDETRLSAPCSKCGKSLTMPHGNFNMTHATPGIGVGDSLLSKPPVFGLSSGGLTLEEWEKVWTKNAIATIRRWEEVTGNLGSSPEACRTAEQEVFWALRPLPGKSIILDGKRYKAISRAKGLSVTVTPAPEKKRRKGSSGSPSSA
jgi:hypothetical protein